MEIQGLKRYYGEQEMKRIEEIEKASKEYRESREECGVKDPILLDEVDDAYFMGAIWADEHPIHHDEAMLVEQGKEKMIEKACEWLQEHSGDYLLYPFCEFDIGELVKDFRKAMMEGKK